MAFYSFRVGLDHYNLNRLTDDFPSHDALLSLSANAELYSLVHVEDHDQFVASIVGDTCYGDDGKKSPHTFVSFEENISSSADKIAIQRTLQYLNNEEYKGCKK